MARRFDPQTLELVAERFKVLSDPTRLGILNALREGELSVSELMAETGATQSNVSRHLSVLLRHDMVARRREGTFAYYRIADPTLFRLCELVCDRLEAEAREVQRVLATDADG